jgi:integrase/recombinase XerD
MAKKMPGRKAKPAAPIVDDRSDPNGLRWSLMHFLEWLAVHNYSNRTIEDRRTHILSFIEWCEERGIIRPGEVTKPILERFQRQLYHYRKRNGRPLSFRSQICRLEPLKAFFKFLTKQNFILYNPASEVEMPRSERRLPRSVLTASEVEAVLQQADLNDPLGQRDRAILEVLYSTGIRRMEVIHLSIYDLDQERGVLMIREGKGKKDRVVPIGERAIAWVERYLTRVRPELVFEPDDGVLFLASHGEALTLNRLSRLVRSYIDAAEIKKPGSCHLFRHTMATLMLENGADISYIQQILGHSDVSTTQIYTQISIQKLKEIHKATHPAKLKRKDENPAE